MKLTLTLDVSQEYKDFLNQVCELLTSEQLGNHFLRFLQQHSLDDLVHNNDYLEKYTNQMLTNFYKFFIKNNSVIKQEIYNELINEDRFFDFLKQPLKSQ